MGVLFDFLFSVRVLCSAFSLDHCVRLACAVCSCPPGVVLCETLQRRGLCVLCVLPRGSFDACVLFAFHLAVLSPTILCFSGEKIGVVGRTGAGMSVK